MKKLIAGILGYGASAILLSHCGDLMISEMSPQGNGAGVSQGVAGSASGVWTGVITYNVINGSTFDTPMRISITPSQDRVTTWAGNSGDDTVAARRSGNVVSWTILGPSIVTEITLQPDSGGTARVTSRAFKDGNVMATGSGVFCRG